MSSPDMIATAASSLDGFCKWLEQTPLSDTIQNVSWIIPTVQSIHIFSIAIVISSVFMVDLRLLGVIGRRYPTDTYIRRFLPWIWITLVVLLCSGSILIIGEPSRSLENPSFQLKMILLILAMTVTATLHRPIGPHPGFWESTDRRRVMATILAVLSLCLWIGIIFAGRWIAYTNTGND
jgi:hypothetical protein